MRRSTAQNTSLHHHLVDDVYSRLEVLPTVLSGIFPSFGKPSCDQSFLPVWVFPSAFGLELPDCLIKARMARLALLCLASLLCSSAWAGPLQSSRRSSSSSRSQTLTPIGRCSERDNVFKAGHTYEYRYFGKAETGLGFGYSKTVGLALDCKVRLSVPEPCEFHLKVEDCQALEHDGQEDTTPESGHQSLEEEVRALEHREANRRGFKPSERTEELSRQVSKFPIQAQIADGEVARVIYNDEEETWVVNLKKAIIDALQVNVKHAETQRTGKLHMENGIHGLCPTKSSSRNTADTVVVEKKLDACIQAEKNNWQLSPLTPVWNMTLVSLAMKGKIVCVYKLEPSSHVRAMTCRETHQLLSLPWAKHTAVATANITQTLRFVGKQSSAERMDRDLSGKTITTILYEHENATDVDRKDTQGKADDILKELVEKATEGFDIDAPALFDDFVDELRDSKDLTDVIAITRGMRDNKQEVAKFLLVQGLVQCNAPACLRALNTLVEAEEIPRAVFEPVVMAMALSNQQDPLFLEEITRSCEQRPTRTCTLMVGALAYNLVEEDDDVLEEEETAESIRKTVEFLTDLIDEQCEPSSQLEKADEDSDATKLILALKAIGNLGNVAQKIEETQPSRPRSRDQTDRRTKSQRQVQIRHQDERRTNSRNPESRDRSTGTDIVSKIFQCIEGRNVPANVTIAAISALRRFNPTKEISQQLLAVLSNPKKKPEVRMAACMASVRMVTDRSDAHQIVQIMKSERDDQLQAFMTTHIKSVMKSEDPHYREIAKMLKDTVGHRGENLPKIKARIPHSVHVELSKFYTVQLLDKEDNEFGAQVEGSLLFTTKSYMPEGMHLNISTQLFGDYVNILEAGACMSGAENLVEKVLGPNGVLSRSKVVRKATEAIKKIMRTAEEMGYKHLKFENVQKVVREALQMFRISGYEDILDRVLSTVEDLDTSALSSIVSHMRSMDAEKIVETIREAIPQSAQLTKVAEKLKRIQFSDATPETLVEILEAFGISAHKSREILSQAKSYGVNLDKVAHTIKNLDIDDIEEKLTSLTSGDIKEKVMFVVEKVQKMLQWVTEEFNLPSLRSATQKLKRMVKNAYSLDENDEEDDSDNETDNSSFSTRKSKNGDKRRKSSLFGSWGENEDDEEDNEDNRDDEDEQEPRRRSSPQGSKHSSQMQDKRSNKKQNKWSDRKNDYEVLDQMSWGKNVKSYKRDSKDEDRDGEDDDEDVDILAFVRVLGNELGWVTLDDITDLLDMDMMKDRLRSRGGYSGLFRDILDGFDVQPTAAIKMEGLHHISTGLGLPLQITLNLTGIATVHVKVQPEGSSLKTSRIEFEPSGALQLVGGMAIDLPSITKIAVVQNTTAKSELELKLRFDLQSDTMEFHFEKPDEELDIIHLRHEVKLVKDDEDFEPFRVGKSNEVRKTKCLPHIVERATGLKICSQLETSTLKNSILLSHGPHELRISVKESDTTGLDHVKISGKRSQEDKENRFEFNVRAPGKQSQREGRALLKHDRQRNHVSARFNMEEENTPSAHFFWRNLAEEDREIRFGAETGFDVSTGEEQHYNASVTVLAKYDGYTYSIKDIGFNYTLAASVQAPETFVNISTTTAKVRETIMMEHNLTYAIPEDTKIPFLKALRVPGASDRDDISKFTVRHGVFVKSDRTAVDAQAFVALLTFPHLEVAEPTIYHVSQIKIHKDLGHVGLHMNTTWLNTHDELDLKHIYSPRSMRGMSMVMNVSRNDWFVALETEVEPQSDAVVMSHELTANGHLPECRSTVDCAIKRLKTDIKQAATAFKPTSASRISTIPRRPHHHKVRKAGQSLDGSEYLREAELKVNIENVIREKSSSSRDNGFWNQRTSRAGQKVFEIKTRANIVSSNARNNKDMTATTVFGNDASERGAIVSLFMVNNATATNIPFESNNFAHILINKEDGLVLTMNVSVDNTHNDKEVMGLDALLQIDPKDMEARAFLSVNTPFVDGEVEAEAKMPTKGQIETRVTTKTEADSSTYDILAHKMDSVMKVSPTEMTQTIRFKHVKLESDFKLKMNLHGQTGPEFARLELDEDEDQEDTSMERSKNRHDQVGPSSHGRKSQSGRDTEWKSEDEQRSGRKSQSHSGRYTEHDSENEQRSGQEHKSAHRQRSPRSVSRNDREDREERENFGRRDETTENSWSRKDKSSRRQDNQSDRPVSLLSFFLGKDSDSERDFEDRDDESSPTGMSGWWKKMTDSKYPKKDSRYSTKSIRQYASSINPTATASLRIRSQDREIFPSVNVDAKLSLRQSKIDLEITEVPRKLEHVLTAKRVTLISKIEDQKAKVELHVPGRGEAVAEIALRGQREAHAKLYDRGLTSSGELTHAEITLELPTESTIRTKLFFNPESIPKVARAVRHTSKAIKEVVERLYQDNADSVIRSVKRAMSDARHPIYDTIRPFISGSAEDWSNDMMQSARGFYGDTKKHSRNMYESESLLGTSLKEIQRKITHTLKQYMRTVKDLIQDTPAGAWVDALPSYEEVIRPLEQTLVKRFPVQMSIIKSKKSCITLDTCDFFPAIRATGEVVVDVTRSLSNMDADELTQKVMKTVKELLLEAIEIVKIQARKNEVIYSLLKTVDIETIEDFIRDVEFPRSVETLTQMVKSFTGMGTTMASRKFEKIFTTDSRGALIVTIPHPFKWSNLKELPQLTEGHRQWAENFKNKSRMSLRDLIDDDDVHIPISGRDEGLRFKWSTLKSFPKKTLGTQTAMIFGDRHVMTFDGKVYSVPKSGSQCTYLMARGTRHENFALIKSHDGITLTLPDMAVTITKDNFVRLNNSRSNVALPVESANKKTTVKLVGDSIEVESKTGIKLSCASEKKICTVEVSMGMWGESTGLLGSNDNEADNDWKMPSGKHADNAEDFLNSYEVSKSSQCQLTKSQPKSSRRSGRQSLTGRSGDSECEKLFQDQDSKLSPCFETVEPEEFLKACEQETEDTDARTTEEITCAVVGAYREICDIKGVETVEPKECETCEGHKQNSQWQVRGNGRKVDVVVVVSEHQDVAREFQSPAEKIQTIVNTITRKLQQFNGQDVRTALVGFSGSGVHKKGHTHTTKNEQFFSVDQLTSAMHTLKFKGKEQTDALEAVQFIVESHDFRPEATKIILVFGPQERQFTGGRVESVQDKLRQHGIVVTVFAKYDNSSMKERDIGMNYDGKLFKESTSSSWSSPQEGQSKQSEGGRMPSQTMSRIAKATRGAVFRLENILGSGKSAQAVERVSETILQQVQREENQCKVCKCQETEELRQLTAACKIVAC